MNEILDYLHDWYYCGYDCDESLQQLGIFVGIVIVLIYGTRFFCRLVRTEDKPLEHTDD